MAGYACRSCGRTMFDAYPLDDGHAAITDDSRAQLTHDELGSFIPCPSCGAKHEVVDCASPKGLPASRIVGLRGEQA